jgi:hypothetical protein
MKNILKTLSIVLLVFICVSCASDDTQDLNVENPPITPEAATIDSYSKNFGYSGETVVISGTNFTTDVNDVEVSFDSVRAEINSVNEQEISLILPETESTIPELKVTIKNRVITNTVENDYNGNIGVLGSALNQWHSMDHNGIINSNRPFAYVHKSQSVGKDKFYFTHDDSFGIGVYRTIDGGIKWKNWGRSGFDGSFYATANDEGWTQTTFGVNKVPIGGSVSLNDDVHPDSSLIGLYVSDDLNNGFLISQLKYIYQTTDGTTFNEVYNNNLPRSDEDYGTHSAVYAFSEFDDNHIWAGGYIDIDQNLGYTPIYDFFAPLILFVDNGNWVEVTIPGIETSSQVKQIQFITEDTGYASIHRMGSRVELINRIYKSTDGGYNWDLIFDAGDEAITSFAFMDETTGWYCSGHTIYKTTDGGISWSVDYTADSDISNISYGEGVVWAITKDKVLKYFTE